MTTALSGPNNWRGSGARGRTRHAIGALAALELLEWVLQDVWSIPSHGLTVKSRKQAIAIGLSEARKKGKKVQKKKAS
jgi:hypothetical protein